MASPINTTFENARLDAKTLEKFVNGSDAESASPRLTAPYPTIKKAIKELFENGGLPATPFKTKALMTASALANDKYAMVTEGGADNGLYIKTAGDWVKSAYDPLAQAKTYADTNKVANSDITTQYVNGNMIGSKTSRLVNIGITNLYALATAAIYTSLVVTVNEGDILFIHNKSNGFVAGSGSSYAFFTENPATNTSQTRIVHTAEAGVDTASSINYQKVLVPANAKYLLLNTKYGSNNYEWAVHQDKFSASYVTGPDEVVVAVKGNNIKGSNDFRKSVNYIDSNLVYYDKLNISTKNIFDPKTVITGSTYNNLGGISYSPEYRRTIKYPCVGGEWLSFSNIEAIIINYFQRHIQFWSGVQGDVFKVVVNLPTTLLKNSFSVQAPEGATYFSLNINSAEIPNKLQIERSAVPTKYEPYILPVNSISNKYAQDLLSVKSSKNLYDGRTVNKLRVVGAQLQGTVDINDVTSSAIPVEFGKYYSISGLNLDLIDIGYRKIVGVKTALITLSDDAVKGIPVVWGSESSTIYIDDPLIKYIVLPLVSSNKATESAAKNLPLQVEEGLIATSYEPQFYVKSELGLYNASISKAKALVSNVNTKSVSEFVEMNVGRLPTSNVVNFAKQLSPLGISYEISSMLDTGTNNLFAKVVGVASGTKNIKANLMKYVGAATALPTLKGYPFTVPSGQLDNPDTLEAYTKNQMNKYNYCHPDIAYDSAGVAGFKYWMVASILPPYSMNDTQWEDEDVFVSNDAKTWQRIRSLYETDKTYTTAMLRLPPQNLAQANARRHGLLPCPAKGDVIEISVPADNGASALERVNITLTELPWKHDPAILIDGGYVYIYHSYHLPYVDRNGGKNRFIVCTRTSDGINWDVVRSDGSTMRITAENSRTLFTKSADGKYNYLYYAYNRGYSNPTVIKYGTGDYELIYGENYSFRIKGTTPYTFDFTVQHPLQYVGSGNHPMAFYDGVSKTYVINNNDMYESTNRGVSFTKMAHYPAWVGGIAGYGYKKSLCVGEGGKVILIDAQRYSVPSIAPDFLGQASTISDNLMFIYEYPSLNDFINKANTGLVDAYLDLQLCKVNVVSDTREFKVFNAIGIKNTNTNPNNPIQSVDVTNMTIQDGDVLYVYATLTSRNGAKIAFSGLDIT